MRLSPSIVLAAGLLLCPAACAAGQFKVQTPEIAGPPVPAHVLTRLLLPQSALSLPQQSLSLQRDAFLVNPNPAAAIAALETQAYPAVAEDPRAAATARVLLSMLARPETAPQREDLAERVGEDSLAVLEGAAAHLHRIARSDRDLSFALERIARRTAMEGYGLRESLDQWDSVFDVRRTPQPSPGAATSDPSEQYWEKRVQDRIDPRTHAAFLGTYPPEIVEALEEELFLLNEVRGGAPLAIADIGAWDAHLLKELLDSPILSSFLSRSRMFALDLDKPKGIEDILKGTPIEYRIGRAQKLPFEDGSLDFLAMTFVLNYIEPKDWPGILREVRRVLARGGRAALIFHHPDSPYMKNWSGEAPPTRLETEAERAARDYLVKLERLVLNLGEPSSSGFSGRLKTLKDAVAHRPAWPEPVIERHFHERALLELLEGPTPSWPGLRDDTLSWIREEIKAYSAEPMMRRLRESLELFRTTESLNRYLEQRGFPARVTILEDGRHQPTGFLAVFSQP